jgi:hypothetical protein
MSLSESSRKTTPPSASGTVAGNPELEKAVQAASLYLKDVFKVEYDDDRIKNGLDIAWYKIHGAISRAGHSKMKARLRNESEFYAYVKTGSKERELIKLLRCMSKEEEPWSKLFENGTFFLPFEDKYDDHHTISRGISQTRARERDRSGHSSRCV